MRLRAVAVIGLGLTLAAAPLQAAPDDLPVSQRGVEEARARFQRGVQLYREENLEAALSELRRAYDLSPSYRVLYNVAQVQIDLRDYAGALETFRRYLAEGGDEILSERRSEVEGRVRKLDATVARLEIVTSIEGAQIAIDDVRVGVSPLAVTLVNPGTRRVSVYKTGFSSASRSVTLASGERLKVTLDIAPAGSSASASAAPKVPLPVAACPTACASSENELTARPAIPLGVWAGLAMTGALAVGTGAFALLTRDAKADFDRELEQYPTSRIRLDDERSRMKTYAAITDGFGVATLVSGAVTLTLALSGARATERPPARETIRIRPRIGGLSVSGDF